MDDFYLKQTQILDALLSTKLRPTLQDVAAAREKTHRLELDMATLLKPEVLEAFRGLETALQDAEAKVAKDIEGPQQAAQVVVKEEADAAGDRMEVSSGETACQDENSSISSAQMAN